MQDGAMTVVRKGRGGRGGRRCRAWQDVAGELAVRAEGMAPRAVRVRARMKVIGVMSRWMSLRVVQINHFTITCLMHALVISLRAAH